MQVRCDDPHYPKIHDPRIAVTVRKDGRTFAIVLSAYNEFSRIERIGNVALRIATNTLAKIAELHDHKGTLGVVWRVLPDSADIAVVHTVWEAHCECITDHFYNGRPLLANCSDDPPSASSTNILEGPGIDILEPEPGEVVMMRPRGL